MLADHEMLDQLKEIFVTRKECSETVETENQKINDLALIEARNGTKLSVLIGILGTIAVPVLGICIKFLFGG